LLQTIGEDPGILIFTSMTIRYNRRPILSYGVGCLVIREHVIQGTWRRWLYWSAGRIHYMEHYSMALWLCHLGLVTRKESTTMGMNMNTQSRMVRISEILGAGVGGRMNCDSQVWAEEYPPHLVLLHSSHLDRYRPKLKISSYINDMDNRLLSRCPCFTKIGTIWQQCRLLMGILLKSRSIFLLLPASTKCHKRFLSACHFYINFDLLRSPLLHQEAGAGVAVVASCDKLDSSAGFSVSGTLNSSPFLTSSLMCSGSPGSGSPLIPPTTFNPPAT